MRAVVVWVTPTALHAGPFDPLCEHNAPGGADDELFMGRELTLADLLDNDLAGGAFSTIDVNDGFDIVGIVAVRDKVVDPGTGRRLRGFSADGAASGSRPRCAGHALGVHAAPLGRQCGCGAGAPAAVGPYWGLERCDAHHLPMTRPTDPASPTPTPDPAVALASLPTAVVSLDADGRIRWCNEAARRVLGPAASAVGAAVTEAFVSGDAIVTGAVLQARHAGGWLRVQRAAQDDGALLTLEDATDLVDARADATRRQVPPAHAQRRMDGEAESMLALAEEAAGIARWVRDLRDERMYYNQSASDMIGLPPRPDGMPSAEFRAHVHPDDLPALIEAGDRTQRTGEVTDVEARYRQPDGTWRHVLTRRVLHCDAAGVPLALVGIGIDMTARHMAEFALRRADERAALTARGAGLGTWELETEGGRIHWDAQMWRLRGRDPEPEAPDRERILAMVHPEDRARAAVTYNHALDGAARTEHEFRVVWPDDSVHWLASRSGPVVDHSGRVLRRIGINWDVTAIRRADEERQARELAQQASRAKSEFLARMSHELRTPLNAVIGFSELLLERHGRTDDPERPQLSAIRASGRHLLALVNDILDLTALDTGEFQFERAPVDLPALVREAMTLVDPMRQAQGLTAFDHDLQGAVAEADPTRLRQALINLLSNAIKYNVPGGRVQVSTGMQGASATLQVADTGRGLTAEQLSHLFEPFNRLGAEAEGIEGTGIGLTITKALVERMGGALSVTSRLGAGSRFSISLPAGVPPDTDRNVSLAPSARRVRGSVLCVEDHPVNMMLLREILGQLEGVTVDEAVDGATGLAAAIARRPDLVLLDLQLPDMDGHEVFRRLQAHPSTAGLRCIAVSANAMPAEIERARRAGFTDFWTKPLDVPRALDALRRHLAAP